MSTPVPKNVSIALYDALGNIAHAIKWANSVQSPEQAEGLREKMAKTIRKTKAALSADKPKSPDAEVTDILEKAAHKERQLEMRGYVELDLSSDVWQAFMYACIEADIKIKIIRVGDCVQSIMIPKWALLLGPYPEVLRKAKKDPVERGAMVTETVLRANSEHQ